MGLFDGIFNAAPQRDAANDQIRGILSGYNQLTGLFDQGRGALTDTFGQGRGALTDTFGAGADALRTNYAAGLSPFLQNYAKSTAGVDALNDALGVNGPAGNARATAAFQNNPGYEFAKQQGMDAILASQAKTGQLASGNTNLDLSRWVTNNANQNWNNYIASLRPYLDASNSAATGVLSGYGGLGTNLNANRTALGTGLDTNFMTLGGGLNSSFTGQGNAAYGANTSIGNANANADLAKSGANANILSGLGAIGGLLLSDERAKEDIEPIGETFDGQGIYRFKYMDDPSETTHVGFIAQEVEARDPGAVIEFDDGLKRVDYARATNYAADLGRFLEAA